MNMSVHCLNSVQTTCIGGAITKCPPYTLMVPEVPPPPPPTCGAFCGYRAHTGK